MFNLPAAYGGQPGWQPERSRIRAMKGPKAPGLKAFSVKQPWAGLILSGRKTHEWRGWYPDGHQLLLVHASSGNPPDMADLRADADFRRKLSRAGMVDERAWTRSAFVGLVEIARVVGLPGSDAADREFIGLDYGEVVAWEIGKRWSFADPVPCHGRLNLWLPPDNLLERLDRQLTAAGAPVGTDGLPR